MSRLIDADELEAEFAGRPPDWYSTGTILRSIAAAPTIDAVPVVKGKWIIHKPFDSGRHNCNECIECSVCGTWFGHDCYEISNFCPSCGADMRGEQDDESRSNSNAQTDTRARGMGATDKSSGI